MAGGAEGGWERGTHPETANLRNLFARAGVVAPHTGAPYSEAMLFGLGGGPGFILYVFDYEGLPPHAAFVLRHHTKSGGYAGFADGVLNRTGVAAAVGEATSAKAGRERLTAFLREGRSVLCWAEWEPLLDPLRHTNAGTVVVRGVDDAGETFALDDPFGGRRAASADELEAARTGINALKRRTVVVAPPATPPDLAAGIDAALRATADGWLRPETPNFGGAGLARWIAALTDARGKRGWPALFAVNGEALLGALLRVYHAVETDGAGGGALRGLYADFLEEAAPVVGRPRLAELAARYRRSAERWRALARAAFPDDLLMLRVARELADERAALRARAYAGEEVGPALAANAVALADLTAEAAADPPPRDRALAIFAELADHLRAIAAIEEPAAETLSDG